MNVYGKEVFRGSSGPVAVHVVLAAHPQGGGGGERDGASSNHYSLPG